MKQVAKKHPESAPAVTIGRVLGTPSIQNMFEAHCPSCSASYQVDERRVPSQGPKMRGPKWGESFQVVAPSASDPPALGAALGLDASDAARPPPLKRRATMLGMPSSPPPAAAPKGPPPVPKRTMR